MSAPNKTESTATTDLRGALEQIRDCGMLSSCSVCKRIAEAALSAVPGHTVKTALRVEGVGHDRLLVLRRPGAVISQPLDTMLADEVEKLLSVPVTLPGTQDETRKKGSTRMESLTPIEAPQPASSDEKG